MSVDHAPHGSPAGFHNGCRSRGGCANGADSALLSCAEAFIARRADYSLARLPLSRPLPRIRPDVRSTDPPHSNDGAHGTTWGYRRGCTDAQRCPNWAAGRRTCAEAKREYHAAYSRQRRERPADFPHGTAGGYHLGCRTAARCPGGADGETCHGARRKRRSARERANGVLPVDVIDSNDAAEKIDLLARHGLSMRRIAALAGVGKTTIAAIARNSAARPSISRVTHDAIMRIEPPWNEASAGAQSGAP